MNAISQITVSGADGADGVARAPQVPPTAKADDRINCSVSEPFVAWMSQAGGSLAVTTYQAGKVALLGWDQQAGQTTLLMRQFAKPMGLAATPDGRRLAQPATQSSATTQPTN